MHNKSAGPVFLDDTLQGLWAPKISWNCLHSVFNAALFSLDASILEENGNDEKQNFTMFTKRKTDCSRVDASSYDILTRKKDSKFCSSPENSFIIVIGLDGSTVQRCFEDQSFEIAVCITSVVGGRYQCANKWIDNVSNKTRAIIKHDSSGENKCEFVLNNTKSRFANANWKLQETDCLLQDPLEQNNLPHVVIRDDPITNLCRLELKAPIYYIKGHDFYECVGNRFQMTST
uniref:Uncharacterized protein n=1 Tax=Romanomermis culicivorax TaxID=13658 RepID=A0A915L1G3_ROMCU